MDSSGKNKICIISPLGYTGIAYYDHSLCQSLSEAGVEVTLLTTSQRAVEPKKRDYKLFRVFNKTFGDRYRLQKGISYIYSLIKAYSFIKQNHFKTVHFQIMEFPAVDCIFFTILRLSGIKIICTPHDIYSFKGKSDNKFLKIMYKLSHVIIVQNLTNRALLINGLGINREKIKIIPHGNYNYFLTGIQKGLARKKIRIPEDKKVILLFGNIRSGKGIKTAISAVKLLKEKNKTDVLLLIAGRISRGYNLKSLIRLVDDCNLRSSLILRCSFIEDSLVEAYYRAADVVIVPYERAYESGVLRYAFSCGMPTVISDLREFSEFAVDEENCLIFRAKDTEHLAERINIIIENPDIAQKISCNAKKLSDTEWGWEKSAAETKKIYEQFL